MGNQTNLNHFARHTSTGNSGNGFSSWSGGERGGVSGASAECGSPRGGLRLVVLMVDLADGVLLSFNCHPPVLPLPLRTGTDLHARRCGIDGKQWLPRRSCKRRLPAQRGDHHLLAVLVPGAHTAVPAAAHLQRRPCGWPAHLSAAGGDPTGTGGHHHGHHGGIQSPGVRTGLRGGPAALQPYRRRVAGRESVIVVVVDRTRKDLEIFVVNT